MNRHFTIRGFFLALLVWNCRATAHAQDELAYRLTTDQVFGYEVTIEADHDSYTHAMKGNTIYTVTAADDKEIKLECVGNVAPRRILKSGGRTAPRIGGPPSPLSNLMAVSRTTNHISLDPTGNLLSIRGDSQLPYLLGNLSLLPFEYLPGDDRSQWTTKIATGVTESGGRRAGPRALSNEEKYTTAGEEISYQIANRNSSEIAIHKTYKFSSSDSSDSKPRFQISGSGKLVLDARDNLPKSSDFNQTVTSVKGNVTLTVPVKVAYRRLSDDEISAVQQQWKETLAAAKEQFAQRKEKQSESLSQEDREKILADLKSNNVAFMMRSLMKLKGRPVTEGDKEIQSALKALLNHKNSGVKRSAADAWAKWSAAE
jgi:hypothetical protein